MSEMEKMDPVRKQQWLKALRSGEFQRGMRALHQIEQPGQWSHCCLGVYRIAVMGATPRLCCEMADALSGDLDPQNDFASSFYEDIKRHMGLQHRSSLNVPITMNDTMASEERDFSKIADYIEQHL